MKNGKGKEIKIKRNDPFVLPKTVTANIDGEVFEVDKLVYQHEIVRTNGTVLTEPGVTVLLRGVSTGKRISVDILQLEELGMKVTPRGGTNV